MADIDAVMARLAAAPGVVFDVRGHPNGNHRILSHLLTRWTMRMRGSQLRT